MGYFKHESAWVDEPCEIGDGTRIWHFSHIMANVRIGERCNFGQNCHIASGVIVGNDVKMQNNVSLYEGTVVEDDVFFGPSCVLTNVSNPRSQVNRHSLYERTLLRRGATLGANCTVVCGVVIGRYAFVGAGSVVTHDVPDYGLVLGVPARMSGWISRHGHRLGPPNARGVMVCPESGFEYRETEPGIIRCLTLGEEEALPAELAVGRRPYRDIRPRNPRSAPEPEDDGPVRAG